MASFELPVDIYARSDGGHIVGNLTTNPIPVTRDMVQQVRAGIWPWNNARMVDQFPEYVGYNIDGSEVFDYISWAYSNGLDDLGAAIYEGFEKEDDSAFKLLESKLARLSDNFAPFTFTRSSPSSLLKPLTDVCCAILDKEAGLPVGSTKCSAGSAIITYKIRATPPSDAYYPADYIPWNAWGFLAAGQTISKGDSTGGSRTTTYTTFWETTYTCYKWTYYQTSQPTSRITKWYTDKYSSTSMAGVDPNQRANGHLLSQTYYDRKDEVKKPAIGSIPNRQALDPNSNKWMESREDRQANQSMSKNLYSNNKNELLQTPSNKRNLQTYYVHNEPVS